MKAIFTGDLQCEFENLDLVETVLNQIYDQKPDVLVLLGDLKEVYNPIDCRILNFVLFQVMRFTTYGTKVFVNLGNHDRVSLSSEEESWLPAIAQAGATVAYNAQVFSVTNSLGLFFLPYRRQVGVTKDMANFLADQADKSIAESKILCFHVGLNEGWYNAQTQAKDEKLTVEDLHPEKYSYVIGGHFHRFQKVKYDNVFYVGSPFPTDWGEANERKGFLVWEG